MTAALLVLAPLLPLAAAGAIALPGFRRGAGALALAAAAASLALLAGLAWAGASPRPHGLWLETAGFRLTLGLRFDDLARDVSLFVAAIALPVTGYSGAYVHEARRRFFGLLMLFEGSMLALVLADSTVLLFAAWELVGLTSFLLIAHDAGDPEARQAGRRAFLTTRAGDTGLLLAWLLGLGAMGTTDLDAFLRAPGAPLLAGLLAVAALGKSAQLPFTGWLPRAMAGPTPVSALLHSATMVAAGAFLLIRTWPLLEQAPVVLATVAALGGATALAAGLAALAALDLKRILAWSTASQLGEMMLVLGLGGPGAATFHLVVHGAFKSALFLAAGAVERGTGERRVDRLSGVARAMPLTAGAFALAALALAGVPPFSGFWSEEGILAHAFARSPLLAAFMVGLVTLAGAYIGRASRILLGPRREGAADPGATWTAPTAVLALAAAILGGTLHGHFGTPPDLPVAWKAAAVLASLGGLALGLGVRLPRPAVAKGVERGTRWTAGAAVALAGGHDRAEVRLDGAAARLARGAMALAHVEARTEGSLDERARGLAEASLRAAGLGERAEAEVFGRGGDRLFGGLPRLGGLLQEAQTGKLYVYTLSLFAWAAAVGAAALVLAS